MDTDKINICDENARFEFIISSPPQEHIELEGYVEEFECRLLCDISSDDDFEVDGKIVGKSLGYRLALHSCYWELDEDNIDSVYPFELLDIDDQVAKLICLFDDCFSVKSKYRRKFKNILDLNLPPNILFIERLEVLAQYRGRKFGEALLSNSIYMMGRKNDLVVINPFPLQLECDNKSEKTEWQKEMKLENFTKEEAAAKNKLNNYYKNLGFKKLTEDGLIFLTLTSSRL
jgi:ribosomal protein S18 acetylase RimI-like enzyme